MDNSALTIAFSTDRHPEAASLIFNGYAKKTVEGPNADDVNLAVALFYCKSDMEAFLERPEINKANLISTEDVPESLLSQLGVRLS